MSNRISGILFIILIALCVIIVVEARMGIPSVDHLKAIRDEQKSETPAGPLRLTLPPLAALGETVGRPLFNDTRRPPDEELNDAPVSPAPVPVGTGANFIVSAIVITDDERAVLLSHPQSAEPTRVDEGETILGWRLDRVENDRAIFSKDGQTREAALRNFGPAPSLRRQRSAPAQPGVITPQPAPRRILDRTRQRPPGSEKDLDAGR
jgi:hypothetical protein